MHQNATNHVADRSQDPEGREDLASSVGAERPRYWHATMYLYIASIVLSVVFIIIAGVVSQPKYGFTTVAFWAWIGLCVPGLSIAVVSGPELVARYFRPNNVGWKPAVHIGLNMLIWVVALGMGSYFAYSYHDMNQRDYSLGEWEAGCRYTDSPLFVCHGKPLFPHLLAIIVLLFALFSIHLAIFVMSVRQHMDAERLRGGVSKV